MTNRRTESLQRALPAATRSQLEDLQFFDKIDSTNRYLLADAAPEPGRFRVALADYQSAGRGRRGKAWRAPPGSSVCLSLSFTFRDVPKQPSALSLAIGVAVIDVLHEMGVGNAALKWPNDVFVGDAKLCGILIETRGNAKTVVVGLGLNVDFAGHEPDEIAPERPWPIADLRGCIDALPPKAELEARLIEKLCNAVSRFASNGLEPFVDDWNRSDWLRGRETTVDTASGRIQGMAEGIDDDGALLLMTGQGRQRIHSGSIVLPPPGAAP